MQSLVGIYRNAEDLARALSELQMLKARAAAASVEGSRMFNPGWHLTAELKSMLIIAEAVTKSALARTESRGAHSRIDYPNLDASWGQKHNIIVEDGGKRKSYIFMVRSRVPGGRLTSEQLLAELDLCDEAPR